MHHRTDRDGLSCLCRNLLLGGGSLLFSGGRFLLGGRGLLLGSGCLLLSLLNLCRILCVDVVLRRS